MAIFSGLTISGGGITITQPPTVPGAPTIGSATATGASTATVAFTAPVNDGGTTITSYAKDADTDALVSVTFTGEPTLNAIADDVSLTITEATSTGSGYYLKFNSPVPDGKIVTALIGFDQ